MAMSKKNQAYVHLLKKSRAVLRKKSQENLRVKYSLSAILG